VVARVSVDLASCVRCAACSILAPRVFEVTRKGSRVVREPAGDERGAVAAAALACPAQAIRVEGAPEATAGGAASAAGAETTPDFVGEALCYRLFDEAERVRWRMEDVPWARIDRERAGPGLRALVRETAYSELTTTTATRRFLTDLGDDVDFTQWVAVWFYEETKHPQVLLRWLHHVGDTVDEQFIRKGRATAPFMKSRMGTLVTNIISEVVASAAYARLHATSTEPVLAGIGRSLAADEARHAASFYAYARRHLERSRDRDADRRDAVKVLYLWFQDNERVAHPVNEFYGRNEASAGVGEDVNRPEFEAVAPRERIIRLIGTLVDLPLTGETDLLTAVRDLGEGPGEVTRKERHA
jgi:ferredoxin